MDKLRLVVETMRNKTVAISLTLTKFLVPNKKNGFSPFSYKFFVPVRIGLSSHERTYSMS